VLVIKRAENKPLTTRCPGGLYFPESHTTPLDTDSAIMDAKLSGEQRRVSTPDPVSHHVRTLNFALPQTAAKVNRCDYCQKTFSSKGRRNQHARQLQHWVAGGPPPTRTTQPRECWISTPGRFSCSNIPSLPLTQLPTFTAAATAKRLSHRTQGSINTPEQCTR
jgi:hypothetical protein